MGVIIGIGRGDTVEKNLFKCIKLSLFFIVITV